ncbi:YggS family pyridoxal phosphate-dependent enzyme [Chryseomicrobium excrementi]|uniref:Pyridoxal phosphate homeostasis protein n=2 Tax=Chryseomicrobium excrementi TaxID=2041346 RepID=A0A2M9F3B8_9BACL|nr:YggS family pyridoxal phosphate-dependent enzyme [Chryseomicrobium excrementi]
MIQNDLQQIEYKIEQAKQGSKLSADHVTLIAVTKQLSVDQTKVVVEAGLKHLGENRLEGLLPKQAEIGSSVTWHFIGSLQTRKVKDIINTIDYLHSLDRMSLADEIQKRAQQPVRCFIQVNVSGESSKHGLADTELSNFMQQIESYDKILPIGLMTMAPADASEEDIRKQFKRLRELRDEMNQKGLLKQPMTELSMGMSGDYVIAVEEGATFVRIGTALVGSIKE